uniref:RelE-like toxin of type II toxin-antitoxin system HigB n=1 Tax=Siphoviridae sp. ctINK4 TaxID=2825428 RepID=A0A8S5NXT2_9CAUD|nr:MAG TPA: RelE-like toxin of type II toxin-antitoxin system HigB [Siphoviridae sp. ctINK4]
MRVVCQKKKLARIIDDEKLILKEYGQDIGRKLIQRISELSAANNLSEISHLGPQFLHLLKGNYKGLFAVTLTGNYRLIFEAYDEQDEITLKKGEATQILIREVVDYHGN